MDKFKPLNIATNSGVIALAGRPDWSGVIYHYRFGRVGYVVTENGVYRAFDTKDNFLGQNINLDRLESLLVGFYPN